MARLMTGVTAVKLTTRTVQIPGAYGSALDFPVGRMTGDARITEIHEGTSECRRQVIGSALKLISGACGKGPKPLSENNMANSIFGNGIRSRNEIKKMAMLFRNGS